MTPCIFVGKYAQEVRKRPSPNLNDVTPQKLNIYIYVCVCLCVGGWVGVCVCGPGSSIGIATDYGLDGPGSNLGGDEILRPPRPALDPTQPPVKWVPGLSRGVKCGRVVLLITHPPSSAAVMEE